jgi:hypothetical protein
MNSAFVEAISRIAIEKPSEATALLSAFAFPGLGPMNDYETRVWVVPGSAQSIALVQTSRSTDPIALPDLDENYVAKEVGSGFAEEFVDDYSSARVSKIRDKLSEQLRPLIVALESCQGTTRIVGLGSLKHVPFAGLKRSGGSLATGPKLIALSKSALQPYSGPRLAGMPRTLLLVDISFNNRPKVPKPAWWTTRYFSSSDGDGTLEGLLGDLDDFDRFVFFGHGQVGQFEMDRDGLILADHDDGRRSIFRLAMPPVGAFQKLREVVLVACAAGQGKVFVDGAENLASRFLAYGAGCVVAPIWPIDSRHGSQFVNQWVKAEDDDPSRSPIDTWGRVLETDPNRFFSFTYFG